MFPIVGWRTDPDLAMYKPGANTPAPLPPPTPVETAHYIRDLLESLKKLALARDLKLLAHLLGLASMEARTHLETVQRHDTKLPD